MKRQTFIIIFACSSFLLIFSLLLFTSRSDDQMSTKKYTTETSENALEEPEEDIIKISYDGEQFPIAETPEVSESVQQYEEQIEKHAVSYEVEDYSNLIMALMMQESEGKGEDPMQASESLCGEVGCIDEPSQSIKQGVYYFSEVLKQANDDVKLALQSYNFGNGFIAYVKENGGTYTKKLAIRYSQKMFNNLKESGNYACRTPEEAELNACYGDFNYVGEILKYFE
ncbi:lysozyme family protein [Halobacillus sp. K22]|uniref:lysozyme family protein n=1 Tax=Halobacillus sp. K22 TaxID=3457431 RepID=UPI003FCE1B84